MAGLKLTPVSRPERRIETLLGIIQRGGVFFDEHGSYYMDGEEFVLLDPDAYYEPDVTYIMDALRWLGDCRDFSNKVDDEFEVEIIICELADKYVYGVVFGNPVTYDLIEAVFAPAQSLIEAANEVKQFFDDVTEKLLDELKETYGDDSITLEIAGKIEETRKELDEWLTGLASHTDLQ